MKLLLNFFRNCVAWLPWGRKYFTLWDTAPYPVLLWRPSFRLIGMNKCFRSIFDLSSCDQALTWFNNMLSGRASQAAFARLKVCTKRKQETREKLRLNLPRGEVTVFVRVVPVSRWSLAWFLDIEEGNGTGTFRSAGLKNLLAVAPIPVVVCDRAESFQFANAAFCDWLKLPEEEIATHSLTSLGIPHLVTLEKSVPQELFLKGPSGWGKQGVLAASYSFEEKERFTCLFFLPQVGTAPRKTELQLALLVESIPLAALFMDHHGIIRLANRQFERIVRERKILGRHLKEWIDTTSQGNLQKFLQQARRNSDQNSFLSVRLRCHEELYMQLHVTYVSGFNLDPMGCFMVLFYDVTHLRKREKQSFEAQKLQALGQLASGISHDFNNLLTAILGFCDLLLQRHSPEDRSFTDIMQIKQNGNRAANLVRQLLLFAKQTSLELESIDLRECLNEISFLLRRLIGPKIDLRIQHDKGIKTIQANRGQIEQLIINLAINARDAMPEGGVLLFETEVRTLRKPLKVATTTLPPREYAIIKVQDSGCGIALEHLKKIFDPFFSTKKAGDGTGLGLSTVVQILSSLSGGIEVESIVGKGTTFHLYLPQDKVAKKKVVPKESTTGHLFDFWESSSILIVEDEDPVRLFATRALKGRGYEVFQAKDGERGVEILRANPSIRLLVTDVMMPGMDGPTLVNTIYDERPQLQVLFVSGHAEEDVQLNLKFPKKQVYFLQKPFNLNDLANKVHDILETGKLNVLSQE
jgi:two-component system cell cycle sensor histidine kinase/response regulator CckA